MKPQLNLPKKKNAAPASPTLAPVEQIAKNITAAQNNSAVRATANKFIATHNLDNALLDDLVTLIEEVASAAFTRMLRM
jgi:hypothetical protein